MSDCPQGTLNRIWHLFARQGISDDLQIIESIAYLMLIKQKGNWVKLVSNVQHYRDSAFREFPVAINEFSELPKRDDLPNLSISLSQERMGELIDLVEPLLEQFDPTTLLNYCLFFQLNDMQAGGRYPTPRHLTKLIADCVRALKTDDPLEVADFACGSGGLLVEFPQSNVSGSEISPSWARLARANLLLHHLRAENIYTGNAFEISAKHFSESSGYSSQVNRHFDAIVMNPPFGQPIEKQLIPYNLGGNTGQRSETVLTLLALNHLKKDGVLAVLQPGGALFSTSSGEVLLRQRLLAENRLEAIIQLPKDAFQPYSQLQTYLLLAQKSASSIEADEPVWFYDIAHDGFSSGRNRQPQPEQSQLPQLLAAVQVGQAKQAWDNRDENGLLQLNIRPIRTANGGYRIVQPESGKLTVNAIASSQSTALWVSRQTEKAHHALLFETALWQQSAVPPVANKRPIASLSFQLGDESSQTAALEQVKKQWTLRLKSESAVTLAEGVEAPSGYGVLFVGEDGSLLSPLLQVNNLHKDYKPKSLAVYPVDEGDLAAGHLVMWDKTVVQPLFFASSTGGKGWFLLAGETEAVLLGWEQGDLVQAVVGSQAQTFKGESWHRGVVVDGAGAFFGVGVDPRYIQDDRQLDLTFDRYYPAAEQETSFDRSAAEILAAMRQKQNSMSRRLDYLLGIVEMRPTPELPSPIVEMSPLGTLNQNQSLVWQRIQDTTEEIEGVVTGRPFRLDALTAGINEAEVEQALSLFELMGLIVPIVIDDAPYYRRVTQRDLVTE